MRFLILLFVLLIAGCDSDVLVIDSDTSWSGGVFDIEGSRFFEGEGPFEIPLSRSDGGLCWSFERIAPGHLDVYVRRSSPLAPDIRSDPPSAEYPNEVGGCS
jgi:hypothetical protein